MDNFYLTATDNMKLANRAVLEDAIKKTLIEEGIQWVGYFEFTNNEMIAYFKAHSHGTTTRFYEYEKAMLKFIKLVDVLDDINWAVEYDTETTLTKEEYDFLYDWFVDIIYDAFNIQFGVMNNVAERFIDVLYGKCEHESEVE